MVQDTYLRVSKGALLSCTSWADTLAAYHSAYDDGRVHIREKNDPNTESPKRKKYRASASSPSNLTPTRPQFMTTGTGSYPAFGTSAAVAALSPTTPAMPSTHANHERITSPLAPSAHISTRPVHSVNPGTAAYPVAIHSASSTQHHRIPAPQDTPMPHSCVTGVPSRVAGSSSGLAASSS